MERADDKRILLVATTLGYQIRSFGEAASKLGVQLVFVSDRCDHLDDPWRDAAIPVRFHEQARSVAAVVSACGDDPPNGIVAVGDRPAVLAAHLAVAFGIPGHSPQAAAISRNKLLTRRVLQEAGLATPWFASVSIESGAVAGGADVPFPAVVKPLALSGSRGVVRVNNAAEYDAAIRRLQELLKAPDVRVEQDAAHGQAIVEAFIPGAEYAVEGLISHGVVQILAIFDKPDPLDGPFFEETIYRTPSVATPDVQQRIVTAVSDAVRASGCSTVRCTQSAASTKRGSTSSRWAHGPLAASAPARCGFVPDTRRPSTMCRSRSSCCVTRSARTCRPTHANRELQV